MLRPLQDTFNSADFPDLLVGLDAPDDAAVWRIDEDRLLVLTTDFFTPIVDDPTTYGEIAAANALSDLYAMGAEPFLALNIVCVPVDLHPEIVLEILQGLASTVRRAGAVIAGGHTIQDPEPKVGLVAVGFARPEHLMAKTAARPGDRLVLTKPVGTGVIATALKAQKAKSSDEAAAVRWMRSLNRQAGELAREHQVGAATDITGFGLLGHALEMAHNSGVGLVLEAAAVPQMQGAAAYAEAGFIPGGTNDNRSYFSSRVSFEDDITEAAKWLMFDAQTSGGLLLCVNPDRLPSLLHAAEKRQQPLWVIGSVEASEGVSVVKGEAPRGAAIDESGVEYLQT